MTRMDSGRSISGLLALAVILTATAGRADDQEDTLARAGQFGVAALRL